MKSVINLNTYIVKPGLILIIIGILYAISLENYLLFRIIISLFNVIIAYMVFIIVWKSKVISENRYLTFIGVALFFIACLGFLRSFSYAEMNVFPEYGTNLSVQLWIVMRYLASISFFVAPLLLTEDLPYSKKSEEALESDNFAKKVFLIYTIITAVLLLAIFKFRNFPESYIPGLGLTEFKIFSEYVISFLFIGSLVLLYWKRKRFGRHIFRLLAVAILVSIFAELALTHHTYRESFLNFVGHIFSALSFYFIYLAIVETGFEEPYNLLFRELKLREEALRRETIFLRDDQGRIYRMLGVEECLPVNRSGIEKLQDQRQQDKMKQTNYLMQDIHGIIYFRLNEKRIPVSMDGTVEKITGYSGEDFVSGRVMWAEIVDSEDRPLFVKNMNRLELSPNSSLKLEYRIRRKDGEIRWVQEIINFIPDSGKSGASEKFQGFIYDITQRKMAEETLTRNEEVRIKEIHHRIKNNLQVISSLLSLQAEKLRDRNTCQPLDIFEAFRESQNRVVSIALIHEELYQGKGLETLEFAAYLRRLTAELLKSYIIGNESIDLKLKLEPVYLDMDTAVPLGIIVNELISNSLKHAFPAENREKQILVSLFKSDNRMKENETWITGIEEDKDNIDTACYKKEKSKDEKNLQFTLIVADNGKGIPEEIDFKNTDSLGLQLVNILVEQIDGCIELIRGSGTEFKIQFKIQEKQRQQESKKSVP